MTAGLDQDDERASDSLLALLGPQRARVLALLDTPKTAGQIAEALHTVPGGATHHLRGLEASGLVTRSRHGQYVIVERTARGTALLALYDDGDPRDAARRFTR